MVFSIPLYISSVAVYILWHSNIKTLLFYIKYISRQNDIYFHNVTLNCRIGGGRRLLCGICICFPDRLWHSVAKLLKPEMFNSCPILLYFANGLLHDGYGPIDLMSWDECVWAVTFMYLLKLIAVEVFFSVSFRNQHTLYQHLPLVRGNKQVHDFATSKTLKYLLVS